MLHSSNKVVYFTARLSKCQHKNFHRSSSVMFATYTVDSTIGCISYKLWPIQRLQCFDYNFDYTIVSRLYF